MADEPGDSQPTLRAIAPIGLREALGDAAFEALLTRSDLLAYVGRVLTGIAHLGIPDLVGDEPAAIPELAEKTGTKAPALARVLRVLAADGIFSVLPDGRIAHNENSRMLCAGRRAASPTGPAQTRLMLDAVSEIEDVLRTGRSGLELRYNQNWFGYLADNPELQTEFSHFMSRVNILVEQEIFATHVFTPFETAVDVGGSRGTLVRRLLADHPGARGIVFDLPDVVAGLSGDWSEDADADRLTTAGGDFFASVPEGADLYLLRFILHDWPDEECVTILRNVRRAMKPDGRVAVIEVLLPDPPAPHPGFAMDMNMLVAVGGRERSLPEYEALLARGGFRIERTTPGMFMNVIEAVAA